MYVNPELSSGNKNLFTILFILYLKNKIGRIIGIWLESVLFLGYLTTQ